MGKIIACQTCGKLFEQKVPTAKNCRRHNFFAKNVCRKITIPSEEDMERKRKEEDHRMMEEGKAMILATAKYLAERSRKTEEREKDFTIPMEEEMIDIYEKLKKYQKKMDHELFKLSRGWRAQEEWMDFN